MDLFLVNASAPSTVYLNNGDGTFRQPAHRTPPPGMPTPTPGSIIGRSLSAWRTLTGTGGTTENFVRIGHSLLALILALIGSRLSRWLYDKNRVLRAGGGDRPPAERRRS